MQRVNFLAKEYRLEPVRNEEMIGICDPEGERPAYSTSDKNSPDKWVATIKNTGNENIQFIPVDKNIVYYRDDGQKESSCDGMILYNDDSSICFVELKDVRTSGWISDAIDQLKETIKVFNKKSRLSQFFRQNCLCGQLLSPKLSNLLSRAAAGIQKPNPFSSCPSGNY